MLVAEGRGIRVHAIVAGTLRIDGGALFGVVPKPLWSGYLGADERNRIGLAMRCLLIDTPEGRVLVDTGAGRKAPREFREMYGIEDDGEPSALHRSLAALGLGPDDVDLVVNTHLHFDHAGGNTERRGDASYPAFQSARYLVRRGEWEAAHCDDPYVQAGYRREDFDPLEPAGALELLEGDVEVLPGVRLVGMPGHTAHHQGVLVEVGEETVCFPADLVPTAAHVRIPWIAAFDLEPAVTAAQKAHWLTRAGREGWLLVFGHDPTVAVARARPPSRGKGCWLAELRDDHGNMKGHGPDE